MSGKETLPSDIVTRVKMMIASGARQGEIATQFNISQPTVSNIRTGKAYEDIPWPNGSLGSYKSAYKGKQNTQVTEWSDDADDYMKWPEAARIGMLSAVNSLRAQRGTDPLPPISIEWQTYMSFPADSPDQEADRMEKAHKAEDRLRGLIYREFQQLIDSNLEARRDFKVKSMFNDRKPPAPIHAVVEPNNSIDIEACDKIPFNEIKSRAPRHSLVREAISKRDVNLELALRIVFAQLPSSQWEEEVVKNTVRDIYSQVCSNFEHP